MTPTDDDHDAIVACLSALEAAWQNGDGDAFAAVFAEDADFVNILAQALRGRSEIAEHHRRIFATVYEGTTMRLDEPRIRLLRPDVATIEVFGTVCVAGVDRRAHMLAVATRDEGRWRLRALHNMIPAAPPR